MQPKPPLSLTPLGRQCTPMMAEVQRGNGKQSSRGAYMALPTVLVAVRENVVAVDSEASNSGASIEAV